jgi:hypothetical protein
MSIEFAAGQDYRKASFPLTSIAAWTWMGWFFPTSTNSIQGIVSFGASGAFIALMHRGDITKLDIYNGTSFVSGVSTISLNTWYWAAIVVSGTGAGQINSFLNGGAAVEASHAGNASVTVKDLYISNTAGSDQYTGRIGANYLYDSVLDATEIAAQMSQEEPVRSSGLLYWNPFQNKDGIDLSGAGNNLTVTGSPVLSDGPPVLRKKYLRKQSMKLGSAPLPLVSRMALLGVGR